ncbi:MAG: hypothetical protein ACREIW_11980, partial [Chthoniobacterales bacterium]
PVPLRKFQFVPKNIVVSPPPLGPDADVPPPNDAEPLIIVFGTAQSWPVEATAKSKQPNSETDLLVFIIVLIVFNSFMILVVFMIIA